MASIDATDSSAERGCGSSSLSARDGVSVPTDFTVSSEEHISNRRGAPHHRDSQLPTIEERTQHLQAIELLKLKLSTRNEQLSALQSDHRKSINQMNNELEQLTKQYRNNENELKNSLLQTQSELSEVQERAATELASLSQKCSELQTNMMRLSTRNVEVRAALDSVEVDRESAYNEVQCVPTDQLTLKEYATLCLYNKTRPLRTTISQLIQERDEARKSNSEKHNELEKIQQRQQLYVKQIRDLSGKVSESNSECEKLREMLNDQDFRVKNFSRVKRERDSFEENLLELKSQFEENKCELDTKTRECYAINDKLENLRCRSRAFENDNSDLKARNDFLHEKVGKLDSENETNKKLLRDEKDRHNDLQSKYARCSTENTLLVQNVQDALQTKNSLRERVESLSQERNELKIKVEGLESKYQSTLTESKTLQIKLQRMTDTREAENEEMRENLVRGNRSNGQMMAEISHLKDNIESLTNELLNVKKDKERICSQLNEQLNSALSSLKVYKDLEKEYENSLKSISNLKLTDDNVKLFPSLSLRGNVMLEQTVKLSSRVLKLERKNRESSDTIKSLTAAFNHLKKSMYSYKCAVTSMAEPVRSLNLTIVKQQDHINSLQEALAASNTNSSRLQKDNQKLKDHINKLKERLDSCEPRLKDFQSVKSELLTLKTFLVKTLEKRSKEYQRYRDVQFNRD